MSDDVYEMPEGIVYGTFTSDFFDKFKNYKSIVMPKSLKNIKFKIIYNEQHYGNLVLQEGTETFELGITYILAFGNLFDSITIPSTLNKIDENISRYANNLIFEDYKNSELLNCDSIKEKIKLVNILFTATYYLKVCATFKPRYNTIILKSDDEEHIISSDDFEYYVDVIQSDNFKETTAVKFYNEFCEKYHIDSTEKRKVK